MSADLIISGWICLLLRLLLVAVVRRDHARGEFDSGVNVVAVVGSLHQEPRPLLVLLSLLLHDLILRRRRGAVVAHTQKHTHTHVLNPWLRTRSVTIAPALHVFLGLAIILSLFAAAAAMFVHLLYSLVV